MAARRRKVIKRLVWTIVIVFLLMNIVAFFHAYKFTHFVQRKANSTKTESPQKLTTVQKFKALLLGVENPRPVNYSLPKAPFEIVLLGDGNRIECWEMKADSSIGTVILFHGYGGSKSSLIDRSYFFLSKKYNVLLVDFTGSGGSGGNSTTIGFWEAEQVKLSVDYLKLQGENNIVLFGTSMGAVAIMRAISEYNVSAAGIIVECPFGSMYKTVCARFRNMNAPEFPMAALLVFWGGAQHGFWAFGHNPSKYAKKLSMPVLLMYGEKDDKVSRQEIDEIFRNLQGRKKLIVFPEAGHEDYLNKYYAEWTNETQTFLESLLPYTAQVNHDLPRHRICSHI